MDVRSTEYWSWFLYICIGIYVVDRHEEGINEATTRTRMAGQLSYTQIDKTMCIFSKHKTMAVDGSEDRTPGNRT